MSTEQSNPTDGQYTQMLYQAEALLLQARSCGIESLGCMPARIEFEQLLRDSKHGPEGLHDALQALDAKFPQHYHALSRLLYDRMGSLTEPVAATSPSTGPLSRWWQSLLRQIPSRC